MHPDLLRRLHVFAHDAEALGRINTVVAYFGFVPARAYAELEPTAGEVVDTGDGFCKSNRIVLWHQAHRWADVQTGSRQPGRGARDHRIVGVPVPTRQRPAVRGRRPTVTARDVRMFGEQQRGVAALFDYAGQRRGIDSVMRREVAESGLHRRLVPDGDARHPACVNGEYPSGAADERLCCRPRTGRRRYHP